MAITTQSGVGVMTSDSLAVVITEVDLDRSFVVVDCATSTSVASVGPQEWTALGRLTTSTELTLQRDGSSVDADVTWTVVTCDQNEFLVVDRGVTPIVTSATTATATVVESDPGRTMLIYNMRGNFTNTETPSGLATAIFNSPVQLGFERMVAHASRCYVAWEVVEWSLESGVRVTSGVIDGTGLDGVTAQNDAHGITGVTYDGGTRYTNTWLFNHARHATNGLEQCSVRTYFDTTNLISRRFNTTTGYDSHIAWQMVTFPTDCCELRTPSMGTGDILKDNTVTRVMDTDATMVWQNNSCDGTGTALGRNAWNVQVLDANTIRQERSRTGQACESMISVCDFSLLDNVSNTLLLGSI